MKKISKEQPDLFEFTSENFIKIKEIIDKYPETKQASAVMPLLYLAQNQNNNWIPLAAIKKIAKILDMSYIKVYEVTTFYSMFNLSPVGNFFIQVCTTTPCLIRGSGDIVEICKKIGLHLIYISSDAIFDGTAKNNLEQIVPNPLGVFGKTKVESETIIRENLEN